MVFSSFQFCLIFLPLFLLAYNLSLPAYKQHTLIFFSLLFILESGIYSAVVMLSITAFGFFLSKFSFRRFALCIFIPLVFFKYSDFYGLIDKVHSFLLPIGISFYTFHIYSYLISTDVTKASRNSLNDYLTYILMFPHLIAGPIIQWPQYLRYNFRNHKLKKGFYFFIVGFVGKILIANPFGEFVDIVYSGEQIIAVYFFAAAVFYHLQIYFDFSSYSIMAIGLGLMFGIHLPRNFRVPYLASNIIVFWRRWHISLTNYFRQYIYLPLGGNKVSSLRKALNVFLVFLCTGIWHGNTINFIIWGLSHFVLYYVTEKLLLLNIRVNKIFSIIFLNILVVFTWIPFRLVDFHEKILSLDMSISSISPSTLDYLFAPQLLIASLLALFSLISYLKNYNIRRPLFTRFIYYSLFFLALVISSFGDSNVFIYFQF